MIIRRASDDDYRAFYSREPPDAWIGFVAERDGELIAFGFVWADGQGRCWTGIDNAAEMPPIMMHRKIRDLFAAMQQEGIDSLYCLCDERIEAASRWLFRLGFTIDDSLPRVYTAGVDRKLPIWRKMLL